jgi:hypothetical protein
MVISTKRFKSRNCSYHCLSIFNKPINSVLHVSHMVFGPELIKRQHCSYHRQHACCAERQRLINSRHHRKRMCLGPELIKCRRSPLHAITQMLCTDWIVMQLLPLHHTKRTHVFWAQVFHRCVSSQHFCCC